jgi:hypothetical protein
MRRRDVISIPLSITIILIAAFFTNSVASENQPPNILSLNPDIQSPSQVEATITWRAEAADPENDHIYYRFSLNGPRTGGQWQIMQDWSLSNTWPWIIDDRDVGYSNIRAEIRDGKHAEANDCDSFKDYSSYQVNQEQLAYLDVEITNDVYSNSDPVMYYCQDGKYISFKNRIYLIGPDLDKVKSVKYILHESFQNNPAPTSQDKVNNFEIWIMTWGRFPIKAIITTTNGQQFEKDYDFSFKSKVKEAQRWGIPMVERCEG